jgi:hypothetical protein
LNKCPSKKKAKAIAICTENIPNSMEDFIQIRKACVLDVCFVTLEFATWSEAFAEKIKQTHLRVAATVTHLAKAENHASKATVTAKGKRKRKAGDFMSLATSTKTKKPKAKRPKRRPNATNPERNRNPKSKKSKRGPMRKGRRLKTKHKPKSKKPKRKPKAHNPKGKHKPKAKKPKRKPKANKPEAKRPKLTTGKANPKFQSKKSRETVHMTQSLVNSAWKMIMKRLRTNPKTRKLIGAKTPPFRQEWMCSQRDVSYCGAIFHTFRGVKRSSDCYRYCNADFDCKLWTFFGPRYVGDKSKISSCVLRKQVTDCSKNVTSGRLQRGLVSGYLPACKKKHVLWKENGNAKLQEIKGALDELRVSMAETSKLVR